MTDSVLIFRDPVLLADYFCEAWLKSLAQNTDQLPLPTQAEMEKWSITDSDLRHFTQEFVILAAVGATVTVMKNKPFEYYTAFVRALAGRTSMLIFGHYSINASDAIVNAIEKYIADLETSMVEFSYTYTGRAFPGNPNQVEIIVADIWKRAFDVAMETMNASKQFFIACMAEELLHSTPRE